MSGHLDLGPSDSAEQVVIDTLHRYTALCAGADTCAVREAIEPLVAERDRLRSWLIEFAGRVERDRREPDKLLIEAASMRAIGEVVRDA